MDPQSPVKIYDAWNSQQAHHLCHLLEDAGIRARVASDAVETLSGRVPFQMATCPVWVASADAQRACSIVEEYERSLKFRSSTDAVPGEPYCYHCGESISAQQRTCPKCGGRLDWADEQQARVVERKPLTFSQRFSRGCFLLEFAALAAIPWMCLLLFLNCLGTPFESFGSLFFLAAIALFLAWPLVLFDALRFALRKQHVRALLRDELDTYELK
jgi:hypothetical protein